MSRRWSMCADRYVEVHGIRTRYWDEGSGPRAVVLVHGLGCAVEEWAATIPDLAGPLRVVALDLPGFGRTEKPDLGYTLPFAVRFLRAFLDTLGIESHAMVGHSLGGAVCLRFTVDYPTRVERLVLVGSAALTPGLGLPLRLMTVPLLGEWLAKPRRLSPREYLGPMVFDPAVADEFPEICERMVEHLFLPGAPRAFLKVLRRYATVFGIKREMIRSIVPHLGAITQETLVVWGKQDGVVPFAGAGVAMAGLPNARTFALDGCGHWPMLEHQGAFNRAVRDFLR